MHKMLQSQQEVMRMYANTGYLNGRQAEYADLSRPLITASAGTYRMDTVPCYRNRYGARRDYQLLYVAAGRAHFTVAGEEQVLAAGHLVLYRPGEEQAYRYYAADGAQVYWIHFTGSDAAAAAEGLDAVQYIGTAAVHARLYDLIIGELQARREGFEQLTVLYLQELLLLARRHRHTALDGHSDMADEVYQAQAYFAEHYHEPINIGDYAAARHISTGWFIRHFKQRIGVTPMQYILRIRMDNARELLAHSDYNVTQIADIVGYDNVMYFSRLFRQQTGLTPTAYRAKEKHSP